MKRRALCPICGFAVPASWFMTRKLRPCPGCATPIRAVERDDVFWSRIIGVVLGVTVMPGGGLLLMRLGVEPALSFLLSFGVAVALGAPIGMWLYPYLMPLETDAGPTPRCNACGYDLRATPDRCPECGTVAEEARV